MDIKSNIEVENLIIFNNKANFTFAKDKILNDQNFKVKKVTNYIHSTIYLDSNNYILANLGASISTRPVFNKQIVAILKYGLNSNLINKFLIKKEVALLFKDFNANFYENINKILKEQILGNCISFSDIELNPVLKIIQNRIQVLFDENNTFISFDKVNFCDIEGNIFKTCFMVEIELDKYSEEKKYYSFFHDLCSIFESFNGNKVYPSKYVLGINELLGKGMVNR